MKIRPLFFLTALALGTFCFAQSAPKDEVKEVPNRGFRLPELRSRIAVAFGKDLKMAPTVDNSVFTQSYPEKLFRGTFEQVLSQLTAKSEIKVRWKKDGERYIIEYSEPLVPPLDSYKMTIGQVIKTIFDAWGQPYRFEGDSNVDAPAFVWKHSRSVSVALANVLSMSKLDDEVSNGVHVITPLTDVGVPIILSQSGHLGNIIKCEYSEDGARAATMGEDGYINVWDVTLGAIASPTRPGVLAEHGLLTLNNQLIFADGSGVYLNTIGKADRIQVIRNITKVTALSYAPKKNVLAVGDAKGRLVLWKIDESAHKATKLDELIPGSGGYIHLLAMSEDGNNIAYVTGQEDRPDLVVTWIPLTTARKARARTVHGRKIVQIGFNVQGDRLACCTDDGYLTYWKPGDFEGKFVKARLEQQEAMVRFAFTPDGDELAYSFENQGIRTEDVRTGKGTNFASRSQIVSSKVSARAQGEGYSWNVTAMAYSPQGNAILLGTDAPDTAKNKIFGYDPETRKINQTFEREANKVGEVQFSRDGKLLLVQDGNGLHIWTPSMEALPESIRAGTLSLQPMRGMGDTGNLAVGSDPLDGSLTYWTAETGSRIDIESSHNVGNLERIVWSGDGQSFLTHNFNGELALWPVKRGPENTLEPLWVLPGNYSRLAGVALNSDATRIAIAQSGEQGFFRILEKGTGRLVYELKNDPKIKDHPEIGGPVVGAAEGDLVAFQDGPQVVVVRPSDGTLIRRYPGKNPAVSIDGLLVAIEEQDAVRLYNPLTNAVAYTQVGASFPKLSADKTRLFGFNKNRSMVAIKNAVDGTEIKIGPFPSAITSVDIMPGKGIIAAGRADGFVSIFGPKGEFLANFQAVGRNDYIAFSDKHYYMGSPDAARKLRITGPNGEQCTWDQWDLLLNRPDQVMRRIGLASPEAISKAEGAYEKRLKQLKFDPSTFKKLASNVETLKLPAVKISGLRMVDGKAELTIEAKSKMAPIRSVFVTVNGVPVQERDVSAASSNEVKVTLSPVELCAVGGVFANTIRVSAVDTMGMEGRASRTVPVASNATKPNLYVVAVGVQRYADPRLQPLEYPEADAKAIANVFATLGQPMKKAAPAVSKKRKRRRTKAAVVPQVIAPATFGKVDTKVILSPEATRERLLGIRDYLAEKTKIGDMVVLFFSGHGDAPKETYYFLTPDATLQNMDKRAFSLADIDHLFDGVAARQRLVLLDTCHSGENESGSAGATGTTKAPAGSKGMNITKASSDFELMQELFTNLEVGSGASIISASTGGGLAQELSAIQHGAFTKAILEGLQELQARDDDGRITVSSLKDYVLDRVQALTKNAQKPTMRRQNASFDFVLREFSG